MTRNTGKPSETEFQNHWRRLGKRAFCFRLADAAEISGRAGKVVAARAQPSDYIVTFDGVTTFAEVKSTIDPLKFPFSLLKPAQIAFATFTVAAKGEYPVYVHSLHLGRWFRVPYQLILETRAAGKASLPWTALEPYSWTPLK